MLKADLVRRVEKLRTQANNLDIENIKLRRESKSREGHNDALIKSLMSRDRSLAKVREAIETIVALRWPDVNLNVSAYEVKMELAQLENKAGQGIVTNKADWDQCAAQKPSNTELNLLRHLHSLAN